MDTIMHKALSDAALCTQILPTILGITNNTRTPSKVRVLFFFGKLRILEFASY